MNDLIKDESGNNRTMVVRHDDVNTGLKVINLLDEKQLASAEIFLKKIIASDKGGIKSVNEGLAVLMRANDLQLPFSTCIEHIHVIQGKTGVDVHIVKTLLSRAGIVWNCTKDYVPQYQYTDGNSIFNETQLPPYCVRCRTAKEAEAKTTDEVVGVYPLKYYADLKGNVFNEFEVSDKWTIATNRFHAMKIAKDGGYPVLRVPATPVDYIVEYEFTRWKNIHGKIVEIHATSHFSYKEALSADLFTKDTFKKYPRIMIGHRAFIYGARDIGSDVLMGVLSDDELVEVVNNSNPNVDDFVNVEEIKSSKED